MEKIRETERFYGCYWPVEGAKAAIIGMYGDDTEDFMAKSAVKWLQKTFHINVLTMSPDKKDYGHHNYPLERLEEAVKFLKEKGNEKIAISGASTTGMLSLIAASYIPDITLTLALTPADFVMEGFYQGKRDGVTEWPGEGESSVSYHGKPLPYLPYAYRHPEYGRKMQEESKEGKDIVASVNMFRESEKKHPVQEEELIKVENIKGTLILVAAEDDVLWEAAKYVRRMEERLKIHPHECKVEAFVYKHGTHFVFPEGMVKTMLPIGGDLMTRVFAAGRKYPRECKETRIDIERNVTRIIKKWMAE